MSTQVNTSSNTQISTSTSTQVNVSITASTISGQVGSYSINGQNGTYTVGGSHIQFIDKAADIVSFSPGSSYNSIDMEGGGSVILNGSGNTVTGKGALAVVDSNPASNHNVFLLGAGVTSFDGGNIQPSDVFRLAGFTETDIAQAFATKHQVSPQSEFLTFSHPGGATIQMGFTAEYPLALPTQGQFHPA